MYPSSKPIDYWKGINESSIRILYTWCSRVEKIRRAPDIIKTIDFALVYLLYADKIQQRIAELDLGLKLNPERLEVPDHIWQAIREKQTLLLTWWRQAENESKEEEEEEEVSSEETDQ